MRRLAGVYRWVLMTVSQMTINIRRSLSLLSTSHSCLMRDRAVCILAAARASEHFSEPNETERSVTPLAHADPLRDRLEITIHCHKDRVVRFFASATAATRVSGELVAILSRKRVTS